MWPVCAADSPRRASHHAEQRQSVCQPPGRGRVGVEYAFLHDTHGQQKAFVDPGYFSADELNTLYSPLHHPGEALTQRHKNVVVIILESFGQEFVGALNPQLEGGRYKGVTPFLDSLIEQSTTYEHSFANGRKSIDGMPSVLSSIPMFVEPFFLTPASLNHLSGLAGELDKENYETAFFHGAQNGSMGFEAFSRSTGFNKYYGRTEFEADTRFGGKDEFDGTWAIWDEPFLQFYAHKMGEMKQPFMTAVFTASSHAPYKVPERYEKQFPEEGGTPLHKCVRYSDMALRKFFATASVSRGTRTPCSSSRPITPAFPHMRNIRRRSGVSACRLFSSTPRAT